MTKYHIIKKNKNYSHSRGIAGLSFLLCFAVLGLFLAYLIQVNSLVSCSYQIRSYQEKINQLQNHQESLEIKIANWRSPASLFESIKVLEMVESNDIIYLPKTKAIAVND